MMIYSELEISKKIDQEVQTSLQQLEEGTREEIQQELKRLREDKLLLENKVKGYLTLSDVCLEYKQELRKLQQEYNKLLEKVCLEKEMKTNQTPHQIESPTATTDLNLEYGHAKEQRTNNDDPGNNQLTSNKSSHIFRRAASEIFKTSKDAQINTKELFDHVEDTPKSSEGSKSMPHDKNTDTTQRQNSSVPFRDKYPMQESIALEHILDQHSLSHDLSSSITGLHYENAPSDNIAMGQSARGMEENLKNGNIMNVDLIYSQIPDHFEEMLHSGKLDSEKNPARLLANFKGVIEDLEKYRKINTVLLQKNNDLQKIIKANEENEKVLLARIMTLEHEVNEMSISRSSTPKGPLDGWVHIENTKSLMKQQERMLHETQQSVIVTDEKDLMQQKIQQLTEANQRWSHEWKTLQSHFESRINELEIERDRFKLACTDLKKGEESKQRDYEKLLMVSKKKANDEENLKEEALVQLTSANSKVEVLKNQISEMKSTISTLRREKQALESERNNAKQDQAGLSTSALQMSRQVSRSQSELQTEIEVLRQQLLVFQEDFERERQDRAKVISVKEDYKKQLETHKTRVQHLDKKIITLERQLKSAEDLSRQLQDDKDRIFQENTDLKNQLQLQREKEKKYLVCHQIPNQPQVINSQGLLQLRPHEYNPPMSPPQPIQYIISSGLYDQQRAPQIIGASQYIPAANAGSRNQPCLQPVSKQVELLPGAWSCNQCTFMNYPGRTVCEMCGYIQNTTENHYLNYTGNETLHARGDQEQQQHYNQQLRYQPSDPYNVFQRQQPQEDTCG